MTFILFILLVIGIIVGTQSSLLVQMGFIILFYIYSSSKFYPQEIAGFIPFIYFSFFMLGVLIGDISWVIQTKTYLDWNISNLFLVDTNTSK